MKRDQGKTKQQLANELEEMRKAAAALRESEERYRDLYENAPVAYLSVGTDGLVKESNRAAQVWLGYPAAELTGKPVIELYAPECVAEARAVLDRANQGVSVYSEEMACLTKGGDTVYGALSATPIADEKGRVTGSRSVVRDITQRRLMERRLEHLSSIAEQATDGVMVTGLDYHITYANSASQRMFGYSLEEMAGKTPDMLSAEPNAQAVQSEVYRTVSAGKTYLGAASNRRKDGSTFVCEFKAFPLYERGKITAYAAFQRDVTERQQAEQALAQSEQRLRLLTENMKDVIFLADMKGRVQYISPSVESLLGYSLEESMQRTMVEGLTPASRQVAFQKLSRVSGEGYVAGIAASNIMTEFELYRKDGTTVWVEVNLSLVRDPDGKLAGTVGSWRDISRCKQAEEALRASEDKYRRLVENSLQGIMIIQDGCLVFVNRAFANFFGYSVADMLALTPDQIQGLVHPDDRSLVFGRIRDRLEGKPVPASYDIRCLRGDGTLCWVETNSQRVDYQGRPAIQSIAVDVTDSRRAEEVLRQSEERFRHVSNVMTDLAYSCLADGDGVYSIDWMSGATERITGYTADEIRAHSCWRFMVIDEDQPVFDRHVIGLTPGQSASCELRIRHKSGGIVWLASQAECLAEPEAPGRLRLYGGLSDITEHKKAEQALRQSEELYRH
ncbi:MAG: PAS domain-containing protein, partial [Chloroflexi bacterium]|nr:PAS domain-containing protein [Chloroflexota bacterium]